MNASPEFYKLLLDNLYDGVYFVDAQRKITYWNKGAEKITGYKAEQVVGKFCGDNILNHCTANGEELCLSGCPLTHSIQTEKPMEAEVFLHHADGHRVPVLVRTSPIVEEGKVLGAVEVFSNSARLLNARQRVERLETIAHQDPLTGLANRRAGDARLKAVFLEFQHLHQSFAVFFGDIDHFKKVNDTYGHDCGDRILRMVAQTIKHNLRQHDFACRWGGEEFLVIIPNIGQEGMQKIGNKILALVSSASIVENGERLHATLSLGATLAQPQDTLEDMLRRADALMYESKKNGRNRVTFG